MTVTGGFESRDALGVGDLTTLGARELGVLLNDIDTAMDSVTPRMIEAEKALSRAEVTLIYKPKDEAARAERITQRALLKALTHETRHYKLRQSRIQSLLRSLAIQGGL